MKPNRYKTMVLVQPQAIVDNTSWVTKALDCLGFGYAEVFVALGATDIALTALKLQEADAVSDANTLSSGADITGAIFGTSANDTGSTSTLPSATDDNKLYKFEVDLKGRKRYLDLTATIGDGSVGGFICVWANLHEGDKPPVSATEKGVAQLLRIP